jgi:hypothetical protein
MKRRQFLHNATIAGAATLLPVAVHAAGRAAPAPRFGLLRSSGEAGARFEPHLACGAAPCDGAALRIRIDGLQPAAGAPVLRELWLSALFETADGMTAPFLAWQFAHGPRPHMGQRVAFVAPRERMRGFALDYRLGEQAGCAQETCALTSFALPLLVPGHYVLLGPRRDGRAAPTRRLRHSGDAAAPLAGAPRDFDALAFRIEAST